MRLGKKAVIMPKALSEIRMMNPCRGKALRLTATSRPDANLHP
jgi:hypothetical protein